MASRAAGLRPEQLLVHAGWIRHLARSLVTQDADADDVMQQTWLAAVLHRPSAHRSLRPWLARVLRTQVALRRRRAANRASREAIAAHGDALPSAEELVIRTETQRRLVEAVLALPEPYRSAIVLHYYEGLSAAEIARRRGVPSATLRSQIHRALERLREMLDDEFDGDRRAWNRALIPLQATIERAERTLPASREIFRGALASKLVVAGLIAGALVGWALVGSDTDGARATERAAPLGTSQTAALTSSRVEEPRESVPESAANIGLVTAQVLDENTDEPLPEFAVALHRADGAPLNATSDADGNVRFEVDAPAGLYEFELLDDARLYDRDALVHESPLMFNLPRESHELAAGARPVVLRTMVGPTYVLDLERPAQLEIESLRAHLRANVSAGFATELWSMHIAPVRSAGAFESPWVRFAALETRFLGDGPSWTLEVASADGHWSGRANVTSIRGRNPGVVHITLEPRARISGCVLDALGPVTADVLLDLQHVDGSPTGRRIDSDQNGRYSIDSIEQGVYVLAVSSARHERRKIPLTVAPGDELAVDVELVRSAVAGEVDGMLSSRSRQFREPVVVVLESTEVSGRRFFDNAAWELRDGGLVSDFSFEAVPRGHYRLSVFSSRNQLAWQPAVIEFDAPAHELRLECLDDQALTAYALDVRDANDDEAPREFVIVFAVDGGREVMLQRVRQATPEADGASRYEWQVRAAGFTWSNRAGVAQIPRVPCSARVSWGVFADGYAPRFGDETAFAEVGELRVARVELDRGWGRRMRVIAGAQALSDVELWADGSRVATSRADGTLDAQLSRTPLKLELRHAVWKPIDPAELASRTPALCAEVHMTQP